MVAICLHLKGGAFSSKHQSFGTSACHMATAAPAANKTKQNGYSYFKVAIYIQAQKGGAIKQPEQAHHWSGALAQKEKRLVEIPSLFGAGRC